MYISVPHLLFASPTNRIPLASDCTSVPAGRETILFGVCAGEVCLGCLQFCRLEYCPSLRAVQKCSLARAVRKCSIVRTELYRHHGIGYTSPHKSKARSGTTAAHDVCIFFMRIKCCGSTSKASPKQVLASAELYQQNAAASERLQERSASLRAIGGL